MRVRQYQRRSSLRKYLKIKNTLTSGNWAKETNFRKISRKIL